MSLGINQDFLIKNTEKCLIPTHHLFACNYVACLRYNVPLIDQANPTMNMESM